MKHLIIIFILSLSACAPSGDINLALKQVVETAEAKSTALALSTSTTRFTPISPLTPSAKQVFSPFLTVTPTNIRQPIATRVVFRPYLALNECAQARVIIGDIVVIEEGIPNLFIRSTSDNHPSDNIIGAFRTSEKAEIISGPECSWGWIMWKIRRLGDEFEGWVAESDGNDFWLRLDN